MIDISGKWNLKYENKTGEIMLPGVMQTEGYGHDVTYSTEFVSGLHNHFWYEREEYSYKEGNEVNVPFIAQPVKVYRGEATYTRNIDIETEDNYFLYIELTRWKVRAFIDGLECSTKYTLFTPVSFDLGRLKPGTHEIRISVDNSMQFPYRPDGHGVSDALGATWNGIGGEFALLTESEITEKEKEKKEYAASNKREVCVKEGNFYIDGKPQYMRGTHFGGDYPVTGMPPVTHEYWDKFMNRIKEWGFNFIRCHSYCPPDAAFLAADKAGIYIQVECGMWNVFNEGIPMLNVLREETVKILKAFGHHPSFVMLSPTNEPDGNWYKVLRDWVKFARETDKSLGYENRRIYTAESGWFYDVAPGNITGTDYIYFHRSAVGPLPGGVIRNFKGWKGKDYDVSLPDCRLPVITHEMGQWCAYPDFDIINKFKGYMKPSNYKQFKACAERKGVLKFNKDFLYCSGKNQLRFLKEDIEANMRTKAIKGYEYLDLHDYLGQGGAFVGILDAFWDNKGYTDPTEIKKTVSDVVVLTRLKSYVFKNTDTVSTPVITANYGDGDICGARLKVRLIFDNQVYFESVTENINAKCGDNTDVAFIDIDLVGIKENVNGKLVVTLIKSDETISENDWDISVFVKEDEIAPSNVLYTRDMTEAFDALHAGKRVVYSPYFTDTDYNCPVFGMKNIFWNDQMGPKWSRPVGIVCDVRHPVFRYFKTEKSGGWQWEDILDNARGFSIDPEYKNIVRGIDGWNRNEPQSIIFEGNVGKGKLIFVSAALDGDFESRPAAYTLKNAIIRYAGSNEFNPENNIEEKELLKHLYPVTRGNGIIKNIVVADTDAVAAADTAPLLDLNPNNVWTMEHINKFPVSLKIKLKKQVNVYGITYLPPVRDRDFIGCVKDYGIIVNGKEVKHGTLKNDLLGDTVTFDETLTDEIIFTIYGVYGNKEYNGYEERDDGWYECKFKAPDTIQIAGLLIRFNGEFECAHGDIKFWAAEPENRHKEIEA